MRTRRASGIERRRGAGDNHDTSELGRKAQLRGAVDNAVRPMTLDERLGNYAARPWRLVLGWGQDHSARILLVWGRTTPGRGHRIRHRKIAHLPARGRAIHVDSVKTLTHD